VPTIVVTGYEPWERASENPTLEIVDRLEARNPFDAKLVGIKFPVDATLIEGMVAEALDRHRPDVWLSLGLAPGAAVIAVERLAANIIDYSIPDNAGNRPQGKPVFPGAPIAYEASIPVNAIADAIRERGIPVKLSSSAGTFACNQLMYTSLHLIRTKKLNSRGGFIHVPCTPGYVAKQTDAYREYPSMSLDLMVEAAKTAIDVSLRQA
jgi:pyroglutamyl-peptidase